MPTKIKEVGEEEREARDDRKSGKRRRGGEGSSSYDSLACIFNQKKNKGITEPTRINEEHSSSKNRGEGNKLLRQTGGLGMGGRLLFLFDFCFFFTSLDIFLPRTPYLYIGNKQKNKRDISIKDKDKKQLKFQI